MVSVSTNVHPSALTALTMKFNAPAKEIELDCIEKIDIGQTLDGWTCGKETCRIRRTLDVVF